MARENRFASTLDGGNLPTVIRIWISLALTFLLTPSLLAQSKIGTGTVVDVYREHCASCHGAQLEGGLGGSLLEGPWQHGGDAESITRVTTHGATDVGMPAYGDTLSADEIRALTIYILEEREIHDRQPPTVEPDDWSDETVFEVGGVSFRAESVASSDSEIWAIEFLPGGQFLATERSGQLRRFEDGALGPPIQGTPTVRHDGQGGLLDVGVHPDYEQNGWIYLSYSEPTDTDPVTSMTAVVRGRIRDGQWVDQEDIFHAKPDDFAGAAHHYGSRFVFRDGYVFFGIGDRGQQDMAQDLSKPNGKIHRLHDDGRIPADNPFPEGDYPSIWSYGHRNPQGLAGRPGTDQLWETEHGPRGGDELNLIRVGKNFGWPVATYGMNYNGTPITSQTTAPDIQDPATYWLPSLGVCGMAFLDSDVFPTWKDNVLVCGLATRDLRRVVLEGDRVVSQEVLLKDLGRVRDVTIGTDGHPYVVINDASGDRGQPGQIVRLVPE